MKSKRFWAFILCMIGNFFMANQGINAEADLMALGTMLLLVNTPLVAYIAGDTARPTGKLNTFNK